ncbi:hypothetical protein FQZ97_741690 [compost metagenome]
MPPRQLHLADTGVQVGGELLDLLHHQGGLALDIGHHLPHFARGAGGAPGQATDLVRHHGESAAMLASPRGLDGGIEGQQVGLAGDGLDDLGHLLDFLAALAEGGDQLAAGTGAGAELVHELDGLLQDFPAFVAALAGVMGRGEGLLAERRGGSLGADHHLGAADNAFGGVQLGLQAFGQAIHGIGHACGGQGVVAGAAGQVTGQAGHIQPLPHDHRRDFLAPDAEQPGQRQAEQNAQPGRQTCKRHGAGEQEDQQAVEQAVAHRIPLFLSLFAGI